MDTSQVDTSQAYDPATDGNQGIVQAMAQSDEATAGQDMVTLRQPDPEPIDKSLPDPADTEPA